jgi:hypothetical protein
MLDANDLRDRLRGFADPSFDHFAGFPTTNPAAREAWGNAFSGYFAQVAERFSNPGNGHSMDRSQVGATFCGTLRLASSMSAVTAAIDFANAWSAGIGSITAGTGADDTATSSTWTFLEWNNVGDLHDELRDALAALFRSPASTAETCLENIANAFHHATTRLEAKATVVTTSGTIEDTLKIE